MAQKQSQHPVDIYAGKRLRKERHKRKMTQSFLASKVGITFQQLQKYESGKNRMGSSRLYQFATILEVPIHYFFSGFEAWALEHDYFDPASTQEFNLAEPKQNYTIEGEYTIAEDNDPRVTPKRDEYTAKPVDAESEQMALLIKYFGQISDFSTRQRVVEWVNGVASGYPIIDEDNDST